jgi:ABC-type Fe3+-hydroxamate transport system substrate-binding protein
VKLAHVAAAGAVITLVAGCSSSGSSDPDAGENGATSTVCAKDAAGKNVSPPSGFPASFPLPPGTIVTNVDDRGATGGIVVTGVTSTDFKTVLSSLQTQLPAKGFTPSEGEVEPDDAESNWSSDAFTGRWAIREIASCSGDVSVSVVARPKK